MNFSKNISLKKLNTFGIKVNCKLFCEIHFIDELKYLLKKEEFKKNNYLILGGGSNIFTKDFDGLIIKNEIKGIDIISENNQIKNIKVGAGENWHKFVLWSIENGLSGIENLALIPGNIGASPIQNIGFYGVEVKNVIDKVWTINLIDGKEQIFTNSECKFKYRDSIFKNKWKDKLMITHVSFNLSKADQCTIQVTININEELSKLKLDINSKNICHVVTNIRKRKLPNPNEIGNSGSFFKNPVIKSLKFKRLKDIYPDIIGYKISEKETKVSCLDEAD